MSRWGYWRRLGIIGLRWLAGLAAGIAVGFGLQAVTNTAGWPLIGALAGLAAVTFWDVVRGPA